MADESIEWIYDNGWEVVIPASTSIPYERS